MTSSRLLVDYAELSLAAVIAGFVERLPRIIHMLIVGLLTGVFYIYSMPLAGGAGGKLGTIAFGSVLVVSGYANLAGRLKTSAKAPK